MFISYFMMFFLAVLGLAFLIFGTILLNKKGLAFHSNVFVTVLAVCMAPCIIPPMFLSSWHNIKELIFPILLVFMFVLVIFANKKAVGNLTLFNCEEDNIYNFLIEILNERNISYEEKRGKILFGSNTGEIILGFQSSFKTGFIRFNFKERMLKKEISCDLVKKIRETKINGLPWIGLFYIAIGLLEIVLAVFLLSLF